MFAYLSKKIAIPNNKKLKSLAWSTEHGYIACGGEEGLLKVLKLEAQKEDSTLGLAAPTNLAMNQTLEGHNGMVQVITWNEQYEKITSADEHGLIIVWMLYKGNWFEEMINNRNKSTVRGLKWDKGGRRICIAYEDGAVIVGSVDGNRIWGKELKCTELAAVEWAPHGRSILFGLSSGEIHVYDSLGIFLNKLPIYCLYDIHGAVSLVCITWYRGEKGYFEQDCPVLAICYDVGRCQIMKNENDTTPTLLETGINISCAAWNENGSVLAVGGQQKLASGQQQTDRGLGVVQFYNPLGDHLHTLSVPGKQPSACAWEGAGSLRLALAIESFIYFTNLRPKYQWTYCRSTSTLVYAFTRADTQERCVMFWNTKRNTTCIQSIPNLIAIAGNDEHCCIASKLGTSASSFRIAVYNSLGSVMDSKTVKVEPKSLAMAGGYVVIADSSLIHLWQFKNPKTLFGMGAAIHVRNKQREGLERMAHIDQRESAGNLSKMGILEVDKPQTPDLGLLAAPSTKDPIAAIATSGSRHLFVARCSGEVVRYRLPDLWFDLAFQATEKRPNRIEVNADASILGLIDEHGMLTLHEVPDGQEENAVSQKDQVLFDSFLRKDVWDLKFSEDDAKMFVAMEKTKMFIFHGVEAEPAVQTSAYIGGFRDLEILGVLLDDLVQQGDQPKLNSISNIPVKALNDCQILLQSATLDKAKAFVEENPHPRLWSLIAEAALNQLCLDTAEVAFVHCQNYQGIEFVKSLRNMQSENVRKAEVKAYFGDYQGAEKLLLSSDRCDLAVNLRRRLGDWFRVAQLAKESGVVVRDKELSEVWTAIGDHYFSKQDWAQAADLYKQGGEYKKLVRCLNLLEDYTELENVVSELPDGHPLLPELADIFSSIGLGQQAIFALMKCARYKEAIDVCLELNEWQIALDLLPALSGDNDVSVSKKRLDSQLKSSVLHLLEQGWTVQAVELLKRAGHYLDAAKLMLREAQSAAKAGCSLRKVKEIYVLVGLLVEKHHDRVRYEQENRLGDGRCQESSTILESMLNQTVDEADEGEGDATEEDLEDEGGEEEMKAVEKDRKTLFTEEFGEDGGRGDLGSRKTVAESGGRRQPTKHKKKLTCPLAKRLLLSTYEVTRLVDQPWRGAEAYHFLMLCQNQLYSGHYENALRTALLLRDLDDILEPQKVYSIIALCALSARSFATASKAFLKLKNLSNWTPSEREELENLAVNIFSRYPPKNQVKSSSSMELDAMLESETKIPICAVTGQPVTDYQFWMCPTCKHSAYETEITRMRNCPVCHFPIQ